MLVWLRRKYIGWMKKYWKIIVIQYLWMTTKNLLPNDFELTKKKITINEGRSEGCRQHRLKEEQLIKVFENHYLVLPF